MSTAFLQSKRPDIYKVYASGLEENQVFYNEASGMKVVYTYALCSQLLNNPGFLIPSREDDCGRPDVNDYVRGLLQQLVRLSNPPAHGTHREVAGMLVQQMNRPSIDGLLKQLLATQNGNTLEWMSGVAARLPVLSVLQAFDFSDDDTSVISLHINNLVRVMAPLPTDSASVQAVNEAATAVWMIAEHHLDRKGMLRIVRAENTREQMIANLIGLIIQSYHAGRGLLGNALLNMMQFKTYSNNVNACRRSVVETLRYDPPVHNTRRVASRDIQLGQHLLKEGEEVLLVLAAANIDPNVFEHAATFDIDRSNNEAHLTFGGGIHRCIGNHFSVSMAAEVLQYLYGSYVVEPADEPIIYEPSLNARIPRELRLALKRR